MINPNELRSGNYLMQKSGNRIINVQCTFQHFELMAKGENRMFFPVVLKDGLLQKCGFAENKVYPLLPAAREFVLTLPVKSSNKNQVLAYIKNNSECFARAVVDGLPASNNIYHLHQLQNLYYAVTGGELEVSI